MNQKDIDEERLAHDALKEQAELFANLASRFWVWGDGNGAYVKGLLIEALGRQGLDWDPPRTPAKQIGIPFLTRIEVIIRDKRICRYCSKELELPEITIDHVKPQALGGRHDLENLVVACKRCNSSKGKRAKPKGEKR